MKNFKIIRATQNAFRGKTFAAENLTITSLEKAFERKMKETELLINKDGTYIYKNDNYMLVIREEK